MGDRSKCSDKAVYPSEGGTSGARSPVRCIMADLKHGKPVDAELAEWAKGQKW